MKSFNLKSIRGAVFFLVFSIFFNNVANLHASINLQDNNTVAALQKNLANIKNKSDLRQYYDFFVKKVSENKIIFAGISIFVLATVILGFALKVNNSKNKSDSIDSCHSPKSTNAIPVQSTGVTESEKQDNAEKLNGENKKQEVAQAVSSSVGANERDSSEQDQAPENLDLEKVLIRRNLPEGESNFPDIATLDQEPQERDNMHQEDNKKERDSDLPKEVKMEKKMHLRKKTKHVRTETDKIHAMLDHAIEEAEGNGTKDRDTFVCSGETEGSRTASANGSLDELSPSKVFPEKSTNEDSCEQSEQNNEQDVATSSKNSLEYFNPLRAFSDEKVGTKDLDNKEETCLDKEQKEVFDALVKGELKDVDVQKKQEENETEEVGIKPRTLTTADNKELEELISQARQATEKKGNKKNASGSYDSIGANKESDEESSDEKDDFGAEMDNELKKERESFKNLYARISNKVTLSKEEIEFLAKNWEKLDPIKQAEILTFLSAPNKNLLMRETVEKKIGNGDDQTTAYEIDLDRIFRQINSLKESIFNLENDYKSAQEFAKVIVPKEPKILKKKVYGDSDFRFYRLKEIVRKTKPEDFFEILKLCLVKKSTFAEDKTPTDDEIQKAKKIFNWKPEKRDNELCKLYEEVGLKDLFKNVL